MTFIELLDLQSIAVDYMFCSIDSNDVLSFSDAFKLWHDITKQIVKNPLNTCGHKLCKEIMQFASRHGIA